MKFLVVDDSAVMRKIIIKALKEGFENAEYTEATDGMDALDQFEPGAFDVALVDWNMPRMLGLEFVKEVREVDKKIIILMVTTETSTGSMDQAKANDIDGYVGKPFNKTTIAAEINRACADSAWRR